MTAAKEARMKPTKFVIYIVLKALYTLTFIGSGGPPPMCLESGCSSASVLRFLLIGLLEKKVHIANAKNKTANTIQNHKMEFMPELYQHHIKKTNLT